MPPTQDSQTTFKPNLTCIFLSARARYIMSNPDETPCKRSIVVSTVFTTTFIETDVNFTTTINCFFISI
jgi:hypothetical protein